MCMYVAHWNIFMLNKRDLLKKRKKVKVMNERLGHQSTPIEYAVILIPIFSYIDPYLPTQSY